MRSIALAKLGCLPDHGWGPQASPFDQLALWVPHLAGAGLLLLFLFAAIQAWVQRARYRAVDRLDPADLEALADLIRTEERETEGEIVVVVLERSDRHPAATWFAGTLTLFATTAFSGTWLAGMSPAVMFALQMLFFLVGAGSVQLLPGLRRRFIRDERAREVSEEQAFQEFFRNGLHKTEQGTGVLLFVSLLERRAVVLADEGIHARIENDHWDQVDQAILAGVREGRLVAGLQRGVELCGQVLREHFPTQAEPREELPNHVIVRPE